uniref:Uncharacterized protein n=1 Tax=Wuchereria bancrofti TaxID=6293 RepID=A0AAF5PIW6_WUCBA
MRYCTNIHLIIIVICCISISEVYMLRRHMHNHDVDETPLEINHDDHKLGKLLSLRTDDMISEKDSVINIRKGDHLTLNSEIFCLICKNIRGKKFFFFY